MDRPSDERLVPSVSGTASPTADLFAVRIAGVSDAVSKGRRAGVLEIQIWRRGQAAPESATDVAVEEPMEVRVNGASSP